MATSNETRGDKDKAPRNTQGAYDGSGRKPVHPVTQAASAVGARSSSSPGKTGPHAAPSAPATGPAKAKHVPDKGRSPRGN